MTLTELAGQGLATAEAYGLKYRRATGKTLLRDIAQQLGIDRIELRDLKSDGPTSDALMIRRPDGHFTLFLASGRPRIRHRFSLAHEIAHVLLSTFLEATVAHRNHFDPQNPQNRRIEAVCDAMASVLLMPTALAKPIMEEADWSASVIPAFAKEFDVSVDAAARRYLNMLPTPCSMFVSSPSRIGDMGKMGSPARNTALGDFHIGFLSSSGIPSGAKDAYHAQGVVRSHETVVLRRLQRGRRYERRLDGAQVESLGHGNGKYKRVFSFVHVPIEAFKTQ